MKQIKKKLFLKIMIEAIKVYIDPLSMNSSIQILKLKK